MENEFSCLFAASILGGSTEFEHHISLNSGSVYTPAVYYVKKMSGDGCAIENINARGVNSHLTWEKALSCSFRPSIFGSISVSETIKIDGMNQLYFRLVEQSILNMRVTSFGLRFSQLSVEQTKLKL